MNISYVVLHYLAVEDTIEAVTSVLDNQKEHNCNVIIVDNHSPDDSLAILKEHFSREKRVIILHNEENLGFARGNNVGFAYAKKELQADFIVLMNNDIVICQKDMDERIVSAYRKHGYAVMGPMILTKDGSYTSNPRKSGVFSSEDIRRIEKREKRKILLAKMKLYNLYCRLKPRSKAASRLDHCLMQKNVKLHGSFMVFSKDYISRFDGLDSRTFMYFEEDILFLQLTKNNLDTLYDPDIYVFHKEDASTDHLLKKNNKKIIFASRNKLDSMGVYLDVLKEDMQSID